ncbi:MAG: DUF4397 domain-containing protein [Rhizobacter sp.]
MKLRRIICLFAAALPFALLSACGGSSGNDGPGQVRMINATTDYASLDLYATDALAAPAVLEDTVSSYVTIGSGTSTFKLKRAGSGTTALATDRNVASGVSHTLVAYSTAGTLRTVFMSDNEGAPTAGTGQLRVFNSSIEAGTVDVYLTAVGGTLDDVSAIANSLGSERFGAYSEIGKGSYRLVVTGAGDKTDIRLDIASIALADQQITTLILTSTPGGVLVHGLMLDQAGAVTPQKNTSSRVRLVAGTTANGSVAATLNGAALSTGLKSPTIGAYTLIPAGTLTTDIQVNGVSVPTSGLSAAAGADLTLMVLGTPAAPQVTLLSDDNRPPVTTTNAKLRLVHAVNGLNGSITLTADYSAAATDVAFGTSSTATSLPASTTYRLEATSPVSSASLYLSTDVTLLATRVYTVFMLGDQSAPLGVLRRDR